MSAKSWLFSISTEEQDLGRKNGGRSDLARRFYVCVIDVMDVQLALPVPYGPVICSRTKQENRKELN